MKDDTAAIAAVMVAAWIALAMGTPCRNGASDAEDAQESEAVPSKRAGTIEENAVGGLQEYAARSTEAADGNELADAAAPIDASDSPDVAPADVKSADAAA